MSGLTAFQRRVLRTIASHPQRSADGWLPLVFISAGRRTLRKLIDTRMVDSRQILDGPGTIAVRVTAEAKAEMEPAAAGYGSGRRA